MTTFLRAWFEPSWKWTPCLECSYMGINGRLLWVWNLAVRRWSWFLLIQTWDVYFDFVQYYFRHWCMYVDRVVRSETMKHLCIHRYACILSCVWYTYQNPTRMSNEMQSLSAQRDLDIFLIYSYIATYKNGDMEEAFCIL